MKNINKNLIITVVVVLIALAVIFSLDRLSSQKQVAPSPTTEQIQKVNADVTIDYAGQVQKSAETKQVAVEQGKTAWDVLRDAVAEQNVEFKDYGGDLGIFISAINGVKPTGNKFWLFKVNGESSKVGVSSYKVQSGDRLEFVISEPKDENQ